MLYYICPRFPGLKASDDILGLLKLMASRNPNNDVTAKTALDGGYNPCKNNLTLQTFWDNTSGNVTLQIPIW